MKKVFSIFIILLTCVLYLTGCNSGSSEESHVHCYGEWIEEVSSTCKEEGILGHYKCAECNKYFDEDKVEINSLIIAKKEHTLGDAATCISDQVCSVCNEVIIEALGHTPAEAVKENEVASTCTAVGHYDVVVYCSVCNTEISRETNSTELAVHTEVIDEAKEATCTETGLTEGKHCSTCNVVLVAQEEVAVVNCNFVDGKCIYCGEERDKLNYSQGLEYELSEDGTSYSVVGIGTCTDNNIIIPEVYEELPVTNIGSWAFYNCEDLISVEIPSSVISIGDVAFYECVGLERIEIPSSVISLGQSTFNGCINLTNVTFGENSQLTTLGFSVFAGCEDLISIELPSGISYIPEQAFSSCDNLTSITIPSSIINIGIWAFDSCKNLSSINIPEGVISIDSYAFYKCSSLIYITIPSTVTCIGNEAFCCCDNLTNIIVEENNSIYDSRENCNAIIETSSNTLILGCQNTIIPSSVTRIGSCAFQGCKNLTNILIPSNVTKIDDNAFYECSSLISIEIPSSVTSIGKGAFSSCKNLTSIRYPLCEGQWNTITNNNYYGLDFSIFHFEECDFSGIWESDTIYHWHQCSNELCNLIDKKMEHSYILDFDDNKKPCVECDKEYEEPNYSQGLEYKLSEDGMSYSIIGIGTCQDTNIIIPVSYEGLPVLVLGESSFSDYKNLRNITILSNIIAIGNYAFGGCDNLESITIPSSVTSIGDSIFGGCSSLMDIKVDETNPVYDSRENCNAIIETSTNTLIASCQKSFIPKTIEGIGKGAFDYNGNLINFEVPNTIVSIGDFAFINCENLRSITIPKSVTSIGMGAFLNCNSLKSVYYSSCVGEWSNIEIDSFIFDSTPPDVYFENCDFTGDWKFDSIHHWHECNNEYCNLNDEKIEHNYSLDSQGNKTLCKICYKEYEEPNYSQGLKLELTEDGMGYSVNGIGTCQDTNVIIPVSYEGLPVVAIGTEAFKNCCMISITMPSSIAIIGNSAFNSCENLSSINIPEGVTSIGDNAFYKCNSLIYITIPNSVTSIGNGVFSGCINLNYNKSQNGLYLGNEANPYLVLVRVENINNWAFTFSPNVKIILSYAFDWCKNLTSITIPSSVTNIGDYAFSGYNNLVSIIVEEDNPVYDSRENCNAIIETSTNTLILGCQNTVIPDSVTSIGDYAFYWCENLTSITIPNSVTSIGEGAFYLCENLTSITIPNGVISIGDYAFYLCENLTCIIVEENNSVYDSRENCNAIIETSTNTLIFGCQNTVIPSSITSIGDYAFASCENLTSITIPNSVTSIGDYAFYWCKNLTSITIPNSVTSIGYYAFSNCENLTCIIVEENNSVYDSRENCNAIIETSTNTLIFGCQNTVIPSSVTSIGDYAFYWCENLTSITIPNSVTSIGDYAFDGCPNLSNVYFWGTERQWNNVLIGHGNDSFTSAIIEYLLDNHTCEFESEWQSDIIYHWHECNNEYCNLIDIKVEHNFIVNSNNNQVNCEICGKEFEEPKYSQGLEYELSEDGTSYSVVGIGTCEDMYLVIPEMYEELPVISIGEEAFYRCDYLIRITVPNNVIDIGDYAFDGCTSLTDIIFDENSKLTTIGKDVFANCVSLRSINIPSNVTKIGSFAYFKNNLTSIKVDENNLIYDSRDNCNAIIETSSNTLILGCQNTVIPSSVTSIGNYAFASCENLTNITIPNSITSIGVNAFYRCANLYYNELQNGLYLGNEISPYLVLAAVKDLSVTTFTFAFDVKIILSQAFNRCTNLESIEIPLSVTNIGSGAFYGCNSLKSIKVDENNITYDSRDNCNAIIETVSNILVVGCQNTIIPESVICIGRTAFSGCTNLLNIEIPANVLSIERAAFNGCINLSDVIFKDNSQLKNIGASAFLNCGSLENIIIPSSVTSIENLAFYVCTNLTKVYYLGTSSEWSNIFIGVDNDEITSATIYYYSETDPTEEGNYWCFDSEGNIVIWE